MGAMGATFLGTAHPELFDAIAALGGPLDTGYFLSYLERQHLGGFCTLEELEAILAAHPDEPEVLDDPARLPCMEAGPSQIEVRTPERRQDFNHWRYTSNGGSFDRDAYLDLFEDLSRAFGNPLASNPASPLYATGLDRELLARGAALCDAPVVLEGVFNREYNPEGKYPVVSFCDGEEDLSYCRDSGRVVDTCSEPDPELACADEGGAKRATKGSRADLFRERAGAYDPCSSHDRPVSFALAVDLNGNGRRDYGEPILVNARERFEDVGADGCPSAREDGAGGCVDDPADSPFAAGDPDPNGDDFHWLTNPRGTEGNFVYDAGEPFDDDGLDGVAGTGDEGEGDGVYSEAQARRRFRFDDGRTRIRERWSESDRESVSFYADGGIRDLFNFDVSAGLVWGELAAGRPLDAGRFLQLSDLPGAPATDDELRPLSIPPGALPRNMLFLYGSEGASPAAIEGGDGDHAGTTRQVINRLQLLLRWISDRWSALPDPPADSSSFWSRASSETFVSEALGGVPRDFAVVLPPGYHDPANAGARYPVLYLLHGYGMYAAGPGGFYGQAILFDGAMATGSIRKMILVFPSGRCCYEDEVTGARVCTEFDEAGKSSSGKADLRRLCRSGTFFVDSEGSGEGDAIPYGASFLELVDEIDARYRTYR